jgi:hypothetical protein
MAIPLEPLLSQAMKAKPLAGANGLRGFDGRKSGIE